MVISFSRPFSKCTDVENGSDAILVKSISFVNEEGKTTVRSVGFGDRDMQPTIMISIGDKMALEASVGFKFIESLDGDPEHSPKLLQVDYPGSIESPVQDASSPRHEAAIKLQKVYKSFRTRRKLADCAVVLDHQFWWNFLDFVELKESSISYFQKDKHETAISRWSRARTRAAKVGKGLSKNDKAQKLALQHWLEAIDPRHRYGHNLQFYYAKWLHSQSREPFFYWLDIGEGKEVNIVDKCPRWKLQQQCIKYLGPMERKAYEVSLEGGKLFYKQSGEPLHTTGEPGDVKWIFVLSTSKAMYVGRKKKGTFQHSSFLAGGAALAAGRLVVEQGILKAVWPHSGHYRPTEENFQDFLSFLRENDIDLTDVKLPPVGEGEYSLTRSNTFLMRTPSIEDLAKERGDSEEEEISPSSETGSTKPSRIQRFTENLTSLEIPEKNELIKRFEIENFDIDSPIEDISEEPGQQMSKTDHYQGSKSSQAGKQLPCKWTTGAGARIRYVRDYPPELQAQALEQVNLSPRSSGVSRSFFSPHIAASLNPLRLSSPQSSREHSLEGCTPSRPKSSLSRRRVSD